MDAVAGVKPAQSHRLAVDVPVAVNRETVQRNTNQVRWSTFLVNLRGYTG